MAKPFAVPKLRSGDPCWVELTEDSRASGIIVALGEGQAVVQLDRHPAGDHRRFPLSQVYPRTRGGSALPVAAGSAEEADEDEPQPPDPFDQLLEAAQLVYAKLSGSFERHLTTSRVRRRQLTRVRRAIAVLSGVPITKLSLPPARQQHRGCPSVTLEASCLRGLRRRPPDEEAPPRMPGEVCMKCV